jgi:hypothetical protein
MNDIIYIRWEGRGYTPDSFDGDIKNVREHFDDAKPIWTKFDDVGVLIAASQTPDFGHVFYSRHGQWLTTDENDKPIVGKKSFSWEGEDLKDLQDRTYWVRHDDIDAMIATWKASEVVSW